MIFRIFQELIEDRTYPKSIWSQLFSM